jgi:hypothetical protein
MCDKVSDRTSIYRSRLSFWFAVQASLDFNLSQLAGVFRFLTFERHRMHDAFDVGSGTLASGAFGECGERAGLRHDHVDKVASHGIGDAAQTAQSDTVGRLGMFEFLNGLPWSTQMLADFGQGQAERFADRGNPSA